jgi:hypothetical protein
MAVKKRRIEIAIETHEILIIRSVSREAAPAPEQAEAAGEEAVMKTTSGKGLLRNFLRRNSEKPAD